MRSMLSVRWLPVLLALLVSCPVEGQEAGSSFEEQAELFASECSKCHTIGKGDRVGPDLLGVGQRADRDREWLIGFIVEPEAYLDSDPLAQSMMAEYQGVRMENRGLTREQAEGLLTYIDTFTEAAPAAGPARPSGPAKADPYDQIELPDEGGGVEIHELSFLLLLLVAGGGVWLWKGFSHSLIVFSLAFGVGYWTLGGKSHHHLPGNDQGYAPEQPIAFSHELHAGQLEIGCLYCHSGADASPVAGIPPVSTCMNCHRLIKKRTTQTENSAELAKLFEAWESRTSDDPKSIEWVRVHRLADFVHFDHRSHVQNGIKCQECHGPVETMVRMRQASDLSMGWCVQCHQHEGRKAPSHWQRSEATLDCSACHQ